jgi:exodeoxyribonuclease VII large subunit
MRRDIFSVSRLNAEVRSTLSASFPLLWIEGEISGLSRPRSGHVYFTLKDADASANAQVRCAMFRMRASLLRFQPVDGDRVLLRVRPTLYEARGDFQLAVETMERAGAGELQRQFEELRTRLGAEGLFDQRHKQELPIWPRRLGVITSPAGAALQDVLSVLERRMPMLEILVYPSLVQGEAAARELVGQVRLANQRAECDVLLLTRGGGAPEDLAAFNDEDLARALFQSRIPVISAVGHEVDFTIADFVADLRAATPSAAAETLSLDQRELDERLGLLERRLARSLAGSVNEASGRLRELHLRLERRSPLNRLEQFGQRTDFLERRLQVCFEGVVEACFHRIEALELRLRHQAPKHFIDRHRSRLDELAGRLQRSMLQRLAERGSRLAELARQLELISPLAVLGRGYSLTRLVDGRVLRSADQVSPGDRLFTHLADGEVKSLVDP